MIPDLKNTHIAVIGLGYVGLPLSIAFSKKYPVVAFDINRYRIDELKNNNDTTLEISREVLKTSQVDSIESLKNRHGVYFTYNSNDIVKANTYIVTVPTPIDETNSPDLVSLCLASEIVGKVLKNGDVVIYESTVYPGCTEEECVPILEKCSRLRYNKDFFCGYSPERINPGDTIHTFSTIKKVTSGSTPQIADFVDDLYNSVLQNGTFRANSIKVAEMSKVVENSQRDLNISFVNELAIICDKLGIDTNDVIDAAMTKWNFVPSRPGLVGGHCIAVDPYYLVYKSQQLGYDPRVLKSGRWVNNYIAKFVADKTIKLLIKANVKIKGTSILILGITFKENCPDCRNTKVPVIVNELKEFGCKVDVYDPLANKEYVKKQYNIKLLQRIPKNVKYDALILCVKHNMFSDFEFEKYKMDGTIIVDLKNFIPRIWVDYRL